ncbi:MAG: S8 family serine peptidase [Gammaproteobacteria bacterium]|nr:S8 family serine peptidase [Gammaproteobacteria bacterium]MDH3767903.1 S8 family serine peptidase [Gammaproteobacteria bacterium]
MRLATLNLPLAILLASVAATVSAPAVGKVPTFVPDQLIVGFAPGTAGSAKTAAHAVAGAHIVRDLNGINAQLVAVPTGSMRGKMAVYRSNPNVLYAEPNYQRLAVLPNEGQDPPPPIGLGFDYLTEQWGLNNQGQNFYADGSPAVHGIIKGTVDADINAPAAWDISTGSTSITVAVLDTGVACAHVDLLGKCVESVNFTVDPPEDEFGHGTHVAGIAAANTDNGAGIAGVGWNTSVAAIKVCHKEFIIELGGFVGLCDTADVVDGLAHATTMGYQVINMSFSGPDLSQAEAAAVTAAWNGGAVLVAAAGNDYRPDLAYPAAFNEVIAVGSFDWHGNLSAFSNFGNWVSVAAPGDFIFSTYPDVACGLPDGDPEGCFTWLSGTSMSSPHVAGLAALLWSHIGPTATNIGVRNAIETNARSSGPLGQNFMAWTQHGMIDMQAALSNSEPPIGPGIHVGDLDGSSSRSGPTWTATVAIAVHDETEVPLENVNVSGSWSIAVSGSETSCTTDSNGLCSMTTGSIRNRDGASVTFSVNIADPSYQPTANHDPDSDSDGTTITVAK